MQRTLVKELELTEGKMTMIKGGRRTLLMKFDGCIKIFERQNQVSILGRTCKGIKKIYASFVLCDNTESNNLEEVHSGNVYEAVATVRGEDKKESLVFAGLRFEDSDPVTGSLTFEVTDLELIQKMLEM